MQTETQTSNILLEKKAYDLYLQTYGDLNAIIRTARKLDLQVSIFIKMVCSYIRKNKPKSDYAILFEKLELCESFQEVIKVITDSKLTLKYIKQNLISYINLYRPDMIFYTEKFDQLKVKLNMYETYLNRLNKKSERINESFCKQVIQSFIYSNCTVEKFCLINRLTKKNFKDYLAMVKKNEIELDGKTSLYDECKAVITSREETKLQFIENDVYRILEQIKAMGNEFNSINYFTSTNFGIIEFLKIVDLKLNSEDAKLVRSTISKLRNIKVFSEHEIELILNNSNNSYTNGEKKELNRSDMQIIINFLTENNIPISNITLSDALVEYLKNDLLIIKEISR